jgi:hypothetical protein
LDDELNPHIDQIGRDRPLEVAIWSPQSRVVQVVTWLFVFASACHLWLGDVWQPDWLLANLVYIAGLALLCWRGAALGWLLSAIGLAIPLLFHRDQLTQSVILLIFSSTAGISLLVDGWRATRPKTAPPNGPSNGARHHLMGARAASGGFSGGERVILGVFRGVTICTYLLAVLHKLNDQFFDPAFSCAAYGVDELMTYWAVPADALPSWWLAALMTASPWLILAGEGGVAVLYLLGRRKLAWQLAVAFHIPLTLTMAPAFAFVMLIGHAAFLRPEDLSKLRTLRGSSLVGGFFLIGCGAAFLTTASLLAHGNVPEWTMIPREWLLWGLLLTLLVAFPPWRRSTWAAQRDHALKNPALLARIAVAVVVSIFVLNGLTPYLGVQYQHAGAMVSNLRIDRGCWNSLVVPESVRLADNYIRVEDVYFGEPGRVADYEKIVLEQLWSPPQVRQMRRNWCRDEVRPFYLRGTFRGREFVIEDVCAGEALPFEDDGFFGVEIFGDYLRFQKNLLRECPQACIH